MIHPLLAYKKPRGVSDAEWIASLPFPLLATPKIDGIRCTIQEDAAWTRSLKQIPNHHIRRELERCPNFIDGELTCGDNFQAVTSGIMSYTGCPDFTFYVFDSHINTDDPYKLRVARLHDLGLPFFCAILEPDLVKDETDLDIIEQRYLNKGAEGVMLRPAWSPYIASTGKENRASKKHPYLIAIKRFEDAEAIVVGFVEEMENTNPQARDALGRAERSSHIEGLVPKGTLGALRVEHPTFGVFNIGTGFSASLKKQIWDARHEYLGKTVKFRYQNHGIKDKPRIPSFVGFRSPLDL